MSRKGPFVQGVPSWLEVVEGWVLVCPLCFQTVWFLAAEHPRAPKRGFPILEVVKTRHVCPRSN